MYAEAERATNGAVMGVERLEQGMLLLAGDRLLRVPEQIAVAYRPGDRLLAVGEVLLHVPRAESVRAAAAVAGARGAFAALAGVTDEAITAFYEAFAARLADDRVWGEIAAVNAADVDRARARGRSTTRLAVSTKMRDGMIEGLRAWRDMPSRRGLVVETTHHAGWRLDHLVDGLGVVGFVFEGRPNVFADATGILRGGNTAVMRIGSDALATARAIGDQALRPALAAAGLPGEAIVLLDSPAHAAAWALFAHPGLSLAVARGSGPAVAQLGAIARQSGTPVSLHGTGGAWIVADGQADSGRFRAAVYHSLDRKVCNTVNTVCIVRSRAADLVPLLLDALEERIPRAPGEAVGAPLGYKLHVAPSALASVPGALFSQRVTILRAEGPVEEMLAQPQAADQLGQEWEWERSPEVTLAIVETTAEAVALFNAQSPLFAASLISEDPAAHEAFFRSIDAPFVGDGFTRWVDGQYALRRPELGLSNWQNGRLFARGGILSGDGVYTVRYRVHQDDLLLHR